MPQEKVNLGLLLLEEVKTQSPGESWLGLDALHNLTENTNGSYNLKIILTDKNGTEFSATWDWIKVMVFKGKYAASDLVGGPSTRISAHIGTIPPKLLHAS